MARRPRLVAETKPQSRRNFHAVNPPHVKTGDVSEYFVVDPDARFIGNERVVRKDGETPKIKLTEHAALHYLASGAISVNDPKADDSARKAIAHAPKKNETDEIPPAGKTHHPKKPAHA